jgi:arginase family enzyme
MVTADLLWARRTVASELELVGADVVEVIPTAVGSADVTALTADRIVREILTGLALRATQQRQPVPEPGEGRGDQGGR